MEFYIWVPNNQFPTPQLAFPEKFDTLPFSKPAFSAGAVLIRTSLIVSIIICMLPVCILAQETLTSVQRDIARVEKEIEREKKLHKLEKQKVAEFKKKKKQKLQALRSQAKKIESKIGEYKTKAAQLKKQKGSLKYQITNLKNKRQAVSKHLLKKIKELKLFFSRDFPNQREKRVLDLESLESDITEGVIEPEEAMNRLFTLLQAAISVGYDSEVYSGSYSSSNGDMYDGKYLRLGMVALAFVSLDGQMVAYLVQRDSIYTWIDKDLDLNLKQNIKKSIKVAEGKAAPELVLLPFGSPQYRKESR
jgi:hypothetical protein